VGAVKCKNRMVKVQAQRVVRFRVAKATKDAILAKKKAGK